MADRYPLIYNPSANQIQELQSTDALDVGGGTIKNVNGLTVSGVVTASSFAGNVTGNLTGNVYSTGISTFGASNGIGTVTVGVGTTALLVQGNARITGILSIGQGTITIDGNTNSITAQTFTGTVNSVGGASSVTTLNVVGVSTLGVTSVTNFTAQQLNVSGVGTIATLNATQSNPTNLNVSGIATFTNLKVGTAVTISGGIVTATSFYGDGTNLTNTGSTLSASSSIQRVVLTSQTSGTMTSSSTNSSLTWNTTTQTLSATNISIAGTITYDDVTNVDSIGIVTARSGVNFGTVASGTLVVGNSTGIGIGSDTPSAKLDVNGNLYPSLDNAHNLGSSTKRWANIYSADLQLSNEGSVNDIDGTWGKYTIQEGENDLFLINRRTGKKYKFLLEEVK